MKCLYSILITLCCTFASQFLRATHGVRCDDNESVSFQPDPGNPYIIHHHHLHATAESDPHDLNWRPRPVEFCRPVLYVSETEEAPKLMSPSSRLLHHATDSSHKVPTVESFPIKLVYSITDGTCVDGKKQGFLLVSKATRVVDIIPEVRKAVAPDKSSSCVRIWSKRECSRPDGTGATAKGDGYELVHMDHRLSGKLAPEDEDEECQLSDMTVGEWVSRHLKNADKIESLDILVETRASPTAKWAREELEFENRLQVGDFVDAQDTAGKWYEAIVRDVGDDTVTVHYAGWASKWDTTLYRRDDGDDVDGVSRVSYLDARTIIVGYFRGSTKPCFLLRESARQLRYGRIHLAGGIES